MSGRTSRERRPRSAWGRGRYRPVPRAAAPPPALGCRSRGPLHRGRDRLRLNLNHAPMMAKGAVVAAGRAARPAGERALPDLGRHAVREGSERWGGGGDEGDDGPAHGGGGG